MSSQQRKLQYSFWRMNVSILGIKGLTKELREDKKTFSFSSLRNTPCPNNLTVGMDVLVPYGK